MYPVPVTTALQAGALQLCGQASVPKDITRRVYQVRVAWLSPNRSDGRITKTSSSSSGSQRDKRLGVVVADDGDRDASGRGPPQWTAGARWAKSAGYAPYRVESGSITGVHRAGASLNVHVHSIFCVSTASTSEAATHCASNRQASPSFVESVMDGVLLRNEPPATEK